MMKIMHFEKMMTEVFVVYNPNPRLTPAGEQGTNFIIT